MIEWYEFVFSSIWHFLGTLILLPVIGVSFGTAMAGIGTFVKRLKT